MKELFEKLSKTIEERKAMLKEQKEKLYADYGVKIINFVERIKKDYGELTKVLNLRLTSGIGIVGKQDYYMRLVVNKGNVELFYGGSIVEEYNIIPHLHQLNYVKDYAYLLSEFGKWEERLENGLIDNLNKEFKERINAIERQERHLDKLRKGLK